MYIKWGSVAIQTSTHWNLNGRSEADPPPPGAVLSPNSILLPPTTAQKMTRVLKLIFHISYYPKFASA